VRSVITTAQSFIRIEAASGVVLLLASIAAMVWANSPWSDAYFDLWHTRISIDASIVHINLDLRSWVNDALMTVFFLVVGLEIKRELVHGGLRDRRSVALPAVAAVGGMALPAAIYALFNAGEPTLQGWGVPMATDIAFAMGVLSLLGRRVPTSAKVFLLTLAIADDIGAILVIAFFYTSDMNLLALGIAGLMLATIVLLNRSGVRNVNVYLFFGAVMWLGMLESGIHATLTGVVLGLLAPATHFYNPATFANVAEDLVSRFRLAQETENIEAQEAILAQVEDLSQGTEAPLDRLERSLHPWVSFGIVPLFALANAGVYISGAVAEAAIQSPISQGVAFALLFGKPAGIFLFTFLAVKLRLCEMPPGTTWLHILGIGMLGGIGFTVSLLITGLAFESALLADEAKLGVLCGSIVSGIVGFAFLWLTRSRAVEAERELAAAANKEPSVLR
jgi:Na+:H+ antiporter, NhaA family